MPKKSPPAIAEKLPLAAYKWIQVICSITETGGVYQSFSTTISHNREDGLAELLARHKLRCKGARITGRCVSFVNSEGDTFVGKLPH